MILPKNNKKQKTKRKKAKTKNINKKRGDLFNLFVVFLLFLNYFLSGYVLPDDLAPMPNIMNITLSGQENSMNTCDEDSAVNGSVICGDLQGCEGVSDDSLDVTSSKNNNAAVCCTGVTSCRLATADAQTKYGDFRCDGRKSCFDMKYVGTDGLSVGRGDIYSTGQGDNSNTEVTVFEAGNINSSDITVDMYLTANENQLMVLGVSMNNLTDIVCSARRSCFDSTIRNSNNLFCGGKNSCRYSTISNIFDNIYVYGVQSADQAASIKNVGNLYCGAYLSCSRISEISGVFGDVYGSGTQALMSSNIVNVLGNVIGLGDMVLSGATVTNATDVCVYV